MTEQETTFAQWLARMQKNTSAVGELARYLASRQDWAGVKSDRLAILGYLDAQGANKATLSAFSHAWASYELAKKRARLAGSPAQASAQGYDKNAAYASAAQDAQEWTEEEIRSHDAWQQAQEASRATLRVETMPIQLPCEECGGGLDTTMWKIPGIGQGVLCKKCLSVVVSQINAALSGQGE